MLARLKSVVLRLDGTQSFVEDEGTKSVTEDEVMVMDVQSLRALIPIPDTGAWWRVAGMCGRAITPVYRGIQGMLAEDIERVAEVLSQVGVDNNREAEVTSGRCTSDAPEASEKPQDVNSVLRYEPTLGNSVSPERPRRKRRRSSNPDYDQPLVIPSAHPSAPSIIITPCSQEPPLTSGHVPYQDYAHGLKLTVPSHPVFNSTFPPMAPSPYMLPPVSKWKWLDGHWQAVLPGLEEQAKKGMYSRTLTVKSRPCRRPLRTSNQSSL